MNANQAIVALRALPGGDGKIRLERHGAVATIVLDHPRKRNAVSPGMMLDLHVLVQELEDDPGAAVLIHGAGARSFCAGGDLSAVRAGLLERSPGAAMCRVMGDALDRLSDLPAVVIAAVEGAALGGGAEVLTAADHVVVADDAIVGFVHASLGVSPGWGGAARLRARVGGGRAAVILASARRMRAAEALQWGVVDELCGAGEAVAKARALAEEIAANPVAAVQGCVTAVRDPQREAATFADLWGGAAHRVALGLSELP
jgi:enoyl-CoA hydratase/carnithine racemase